MITSFNDFLTERYSEYIETDVYNGPPIIYPKGDPSIGSHSAGANGGVIGGADTGGEFYKKGDITSSGEVTKPYTYNINKIKYKKDRKRAKLVKYLNNLDKETIK
jgi:hypothetical protein